MCGIAGYIRLFGNCASFDMRILDRLHCALAHRGPDGHGVWVNQQAQIALVHRRLKIIDVSDAGAQPMSSADKKIMVTFNGEIYNYLSLKAELQSLGVTFISATDTEVIIQAYAHWGIECIHKFEGMFAFALFDVEKDQLYLVRDRIGIKPLFFSLQSGVLSFASEIKALWQLPWIEKKINRTAVSHYLTYMATPAPLTVYDGIYKLPAGFYAVCDARRAVTFHRWYDPAQALQKHVVLSHADHVERITTLLLSSVQKHMRADVPVGALLSGGIDSSLIVALMAQHSDNIKTFNISFADFAGSDERVWARQVATQFQTDHHEYVLSQTDAFDLFCAMAVHTDEPVADSVALPLYALARAVKHAGVSVVQVGEGADELFCGYPLYGQYIQLQPWWDATQRIIPFQIRKQMWRAATKMPLSATKQDLMRRWAYNRPCFLGGAIATSEASKSSVLFDHDHLIVQDPIVHAIYPGMQMHRSSDAIMQYHGAQLRRVAPQADFLQEMIYLELMHRLPELLLMRADVMTMAHGVEARVPFLDHLLVEYALRIPQTVKYHQGITKYLLKKVSERFLSPDVIYRKKVGFTTPAVSWFRSRGPFLTYFQDMLHTSHHAYADIIQRSAVDRMLTEHAAGTHNHAVQLWTIQMLLASGQ